MSRHLVRQIRKSRNGATGFVASFALLVLGGCFGGLGESEITEAINEAIKGNDTCYSLQQANVTSWPLRVRRPLGAFSISPLDPILAAMQSAGYLKIAEEKQRSGIMQVHLDVISPTDEAKEWWNEKGGFCVGDRVVDEVLEWTEPTAESGQPVVVQFTWRLDPPSWAQKPEFHAIEGLGDSVPGQAFLQKTNKGWRAAVR